MQFEDDFISTPDGGGFGDQWEEEEEDLEEDQQQSIFPEQFIDQRHLQFMQRLLFCHLFR